MVQRGWLVPHRGALCHRGWEWEAKLMAQCGLLGSMWEVSSDVARLPSVTWDSAVDFHLIIQVIVYSVV